MFINLIWLNNLEKFILINKDRSRIKVFESFENVSKPSPSIDAMGHTLDVHLKSYARFMTKELAENFDKELVEV